TLTELWEKRKGVQLTHGDYDEIGQVAGAIARRAEAQYGSLTPERQEIALRVFTRMVRVSGANEEGTDTRQGLKLRDLTPVELRVIEVFVKARLLVLGHSQETDEE